MSGERVWLAVTALLVLAGLWQVLDGAVAYVLLTFLS
jgi:hypothetical protein